jgi:hypothetical protein
MFLPVDFAAWRPHHPREIEEFRYGLLVRSCNRPGGNPVLLRGREAHLTGAQS